MLLYTFAPPFSLRRNIPNIFHEALQPPPLGPFLLPSLGVQIVVIFLRVDLQERGHRHRFRMYQDGFLWQCGRAAPKVWQIRDVWMDVPLEV